jgi:hypothetical protein
VIERRQLPRGRVYYGGMVAFNARGSTLACVVRNFSRFGAKVEFENPALVPDEVDFDIERKRLSCPARLVWRDRHAAGCFPMYTRRAASFRWNGRASCTPASEQTANCSRVSISSGPDTDAVNEDEVA